jgi:uncharacterized protein YuzE
MSKYNISLNYPFEYYMDKIQMMYFKEEDVLHLAISDDKETGSIEISPNVTAELNKEGELIGIEIFNASSFIRDSIMETVQAKVLNLTGNTCNQTLENRKSKIVNRNSKIGGLNENCRMCKTSS